MLTSVPKQIEEVIVKELPDRYISFGRRNWILLNRDVATLQKNLQGKLPSRENITKLLHRVVLKSSKSSNKVSSSPAISTDRITDHRMNSQKRLLSEEYGINFPTDKTKRKKTGHCHSTATSTQTTASTGASSCTSSIPVVSCTQEAEDFTLALKLQQEELKCRKNTKNCNRKNTKNCNRKNMYVDSPNLPVSVDTQQLTEEEPTQNRDASMEFEANAAAALVELKRRSKQNN